MQFPRYMCKVFRTKIHRNICYSINNALETRKVLERKPDALDVVSEDLTEISPYFLKSFNLAAYVNSSQSMKNLVELKVDLSKIEKKPFISEQLFNSDIEKKLKSHIFFLKDFIDSEKIGAYITKNPMILCEPLDDLEVRINYLKSKKFSDDQIKRVVSKNPFWLMFSTKRIDRRLGFFQEKYNLIGQEVRLLTTKNSKIITYNLHHITTNTFVIKEEMGFEDNEIKQLILYKPKLWMLNQRALLERFNFLHNIMKISHSMLLKFPEVLLSRQFRVKQRHLFLQELGRAQYDPTKENYVPIIALVEGTDVEFCKKYAKCHVSAFNIFLKTL